MKALSAGTWEAWHNQDEKIQAYKPSLQIGQCVAQVPRSFDYLVKPFDMERIANTLNRVKDMMDVKKTEEKTESSHGKLIIKGKEEINLVDTDEIIMIERIDGVSRIVTKDEVFITTQSLASLEEKVDPEKFMRCHKSYIIRTDAIKKLEVYGRWTYVVTLKDIEDTALMTSAKYDEIKKVFG